MFVEDSQLGVNFLEVVSAVLPKGSVGAKLVTNIVTYQKAKKTAEAQKKAAAELQQSVSQLEEQKKTILAAIEVKKREQAASGPSLSSIPSWVFIAVPVVIGFTLLRARKG